MWIKEWERQQSAESSSTMKTTLTADRPGTKILTFQIAGMEHINGLDRQTQNATGMAYQRSGADLHADSQYIYTNR